MDIDTNMDINNYTVTIMYTDIHINWIIIRLTIIKTDILVKYWY